MKTDKHWVNPSPITCGICQTTKFPLITSGTPAVLICGSCDGWPPKLEPPKWGDLVRGEHVQGCGAGSDSSKRCICPKK